MPNMAKGFSVERSITDAQPDKKVTRGPANLKRVAE